MNINLAFVFLTSCTFAIASPTSNEFSPCQQMATSVLSKCLEESHGYINEQCWKTSMRQTQVCYLKVHESHSSDQKMIEAKKKIIENSRNKPTVE